ncbi:MAG: 8-oxoguanine deaminase [Proteobacteria bacterium]|nr:MAG: 8-oxoguanine deaminase [Pseudomonadota bacterium]
MRTWIQAPLGALTRDDTPCGGLLIVDGVIESVLEPGGTPEDAVDEQFDASDLVLLPGLVNTHHHYYQTLTRALPAAQDKALFAWLKSLYPVWARLTPEMIGVATRLACAELLLSGCTTSADHHYLFPKQAADAFDVQVDAVSRSGMRATLTRGSMSVGERAGGLPPESTVQDEDTILFDCERVVDRYHDGTPGARLQVALAPCSPFSVSLSLMRDTAALARSRGVRLHTHLAETTDETDYCLRKYGMRPLDLLDSADWLGDDVWLAHGVHFDDAEIARLGEAGVGVAHCPSSNMMLASGSCRTLELEQAGVPVGLAVDGSASNDGSNMIQECRQAMLLQRLHYGAERIAHRDALRWATRGSARCLGRADLGEIAVGKAADLAFFALDEMRFSGAADPLAALLHCGAHRARYVMVGGQWVVWDGELSTLDVDALRYEHGALARQLLAA